MNYVVKAQKNDLVKVVQGESSPGWNLQRWKGLSAQVGESMLTGLVSTLINTGRILRRSLRRKPKLRFSPSD